MLSSARGASLKTPKGRKYFPTPPPPPPAPGKSMKAVQKRQERLAENRDWLSQEKTIQVIQTLQLFLLFLQAAQAQCIPGTQIQQEPQDVQEDIDLDQVYDQTDEKQAASCQCDEKDQSIQLSYRKSYLIRGSQHQEKAQKGPSQVEPKGKCQKCQRTADEFQNDQQGSQIENRQDGPSHVILGTYQTCQEIGHQNQRVKQEKRPPWEEHQPQFQEQAEQLQTRLQTTDKDQQPIRRRHQVRLQKQQNWQKQQEEKEQGLKSVTKQGQGLHARAEGSNFGAPGKHKNPNICCVPGQIAFIPRPPSGDLCAVSMATAA